MSHSVGILDVWFLLSPFPHAPTPRRGVLMKEIKWWVPVNWPRRYHSNTTTSLIFPHTAGSCGQAQELWYVCASWFWLTFISYYPVLQQSIPFLGARHYNPILGWHPAHSAGVDKGLPRTAGMRAPEKKLMMMIWFSWIKSRSRRLMKNIHHSNIPVR